MDAQVKKICDGEFKCASCDSKIGINHTYCPFCGKKLSWKHTFDTIDPEAAIRYGGDFFEVKKMEIERIDGRPDRLWLRAETAFPHLDGEKAEICERWRHAGEFSELIELEPGSLHLKIDGGDWIFNTEGVFFQPDGEDPIMVLRVPTPLLKVSGVATCDSSDDF